MDAANKEIISLWIGKQSQQAAFSFYNLQAEQVFDEQEDPITQASIWKNMNKMSPRMIIFDTKIERLATVREVNNKKILQKMKQQDGMNSLLGMFSHIDTKPLQKHQDQEPVIEPEFSNWTDNESHYQLIDQGFTALPNSSKQNPDIELQRFLTFEQFYKINKDISQNRIRKQLENTDFLKVFTICTDQSYSGYTAKTIEYLRQQCPKKCYLLCSLTQTEQLPLVSLPKLYDQTDIFLPINTGCIKYPYFTNTTFCKDFAPLFSSLLTPFAMKDVDPYSYLSSISNDNRKLFNCAFTLPVIDSEMNLSKETNIFKFQEASTREFKKNIKLTSKDIVDKYLSMQKGKNKEIQEVELRVNLGNSSYLSIGNQKSKGNFISESYVLKGQFNNLQKLFQPRTQITNLSLKSLLGIFSSPEQPQKTYNSYYHPFYFEKVQAYPFHSVIFSHEKFGESIRTSLKPANKSKIFNEQWPECRQKVLHIADSYLEQHQQSD